MKKRKSRENNSQSKQKESVNISKENMNFFKRWFTWEKIVGLATIVTAVVTIYMLWPKSPTNRIKDNIKNNIQIIKSNVNPEKYENLIDAHKDVKLVCDFQDTLLRFVNEWESFESMPPLKEYESESKEEIMSIILSKLELKKNSNASFLSLLQCIDRILDYGKENNIAYYIPNKAKWIAIIKSAQKWKAVSDKKNDECVENIFNIIKNENPKKEISKKDILEMVEPIEELNEDIDNYKFIDDALSYIIELNN